MIKNKKINDQGFVLSIFCDFVERRFDDEEWPEKKKLKMGLDAINSFIDELKGKIEGGILDRILICNPEKYYIDELDKGIKKIEYFDGIKIYLLVRKTMPAETMNDLLLEMDDYGFYASYPNDDGHVVVQGYDKGEYDTGYFAAIAEGDPESWDPENYRATENIDGLGMYLYGIFFPHNIAEDIILNNLKINDHVDVKDNKYVKSYCEKAEKLTNNSGNYLGIALAIAEDIGDKEWAKKVFLKSEKTADNFSNFRELADSIFEKLGDQDWAKKVFKKSEKIIDGFSDHIILADSINEKMKDKKWVKDIYEKIDGKGEDFSEIHELASEVFGKLNDKEWAKKIYKEAEEKAEDSYEFNGLAESVRDNLGDKKWAKLLEKKAKELEEENDDEDDD
tara:strand:+ start:231 stop:1409 length:1179 start_codon:yes stop_codon:yes gene_type:complete